VIVKASELRARMIDQLRSGLAMSEPVERGLRALPREAFVPGTELDRVYSGMVVPTKWDAGGMPISSSSEVGVMAVMADQLGLADGQRVLEIGSGTGYNAALLASIVGERGRVTTVEIDPDLAYSAREHLVRTGFDRVEVRVADGWLGWPDAAPYDRIELTASTFDVSPRWVEQLADDGRLVLPLRTLAGSQTLVAFRKSGATLRSTSLRPGSFMPLRGTNVGSEEVITAGDYEFELAAASPGAVKTATALLATDPRVEIGPPTQWGSYSVLALSGPDTIALRKKRMMGGGVGVIDLDAPGIAVLEIAVAAVAGPVTLITTFGVPAVADRLRERLANLSRDGLGILSIVAAPSDGGTPEGDIVVRRKNYTFAYTRSAAA
jgi:protein-L-isoaspartate(D-aspartate) O-methyltransferase